jgi:hypothetical protein
VTPDPFGACRKNNTRTVWVAQRGSLARRVDIATRLTAGTLGGLALLLAPGQYGVAGFAVLAVYAARPPKSTNPERKP